MNKVIILGLFITSILQINLNAETIIDTLYSIPYLDGGISYNYNNNQYFVNTGDYGFYAGDYGWSSWGWGKSYLTFLLPEIPEGYELVHAEISVDQCESWGNNDPGIFPIWDVNPLPDTTACIVDHIDYGDALDLADWTAGDLGDPQTLASNIGIISDNAVYEFKSIVVTDCVIQDYNEARSRTQYRLRFIVNNDWDNCDDMLNFHSSNSSNIERWPYIVYTWWDGQNSTGENEVSQLKRKMETYPNPFNGEVTISFSLNVSNSSMEIFNVKGQLIFVQNDLPASGSLTWKCKDQTSGIYFVKISNEKQQVVKKVTYLK
ncbi:MAG: T9SS type A sorting domain-containing protein [Ignavibacteria bacterium]|jgi:hypothetical protein